MNIKDVMYSKRLLLYKDRIYYIARETGKNYLVLELDKETCSICGGIVDGRKARVLKKHYMSKDRTEGIVEKSVLGAVVR